MQILGAPRSGAQKLQEHGDDAMVMAAEPSTSFDDEDWEW